MVDKMTKEQRRKTMQAIKAKSKLEDSVTRRLWARGVRFRKNVRGMVGTPDIAIKKYKVVIFIDSCFWHFCPIHGKMPKSNIPFWKKKLERNQERDKEVTEYYLDKGWNIMRIWEHEIREDLESVVDTIVDFIELAKKSNLSN
ncbi:very short patch repair endonuclease [Oceanobacillus luteolus]|uniref:Very short patch repair endonuclease n=1 Tax=Oceanobacillus luteolus TaxID=1274358 RepID=A0ABW4HVH1_9BACI